MIRVPTDRTPTHPGEILLEEYLKPMNLSQQRLADAIHVPFHSVSMRLSTAVAVYLSSFFQILQVFANDSGNGPQSRRPESKKRCRS